MKTIALELPDSLIKAAHDYVKAGLFKSDSEVCQAAVADFLRRNRVDLIERFAKEDIDWAVKEAARPR